MKEKIYTRQLRPDDYSLSFDLWRAKNGTSMLRYCNILSDLYYIFVEEVCPDLVKIWYL